jgi:hypothetical protein
MIYLLLSMDVKLYCINKLRKYQNSIHKLVTVLYLFIYLFFCVYVCE